jgi:hypothetical protein
LRQRTLAFAALAALASLLAAAQPTAGVRRNGGLPLDVPAAGLLILRDGGVGEPDVTLGVRHWSWEAEPTLELFAQHADEATRRAALDGLVSTAVAAIEANRSLSGLVDWTEATLTETAHEHSDQAVAVARGVVAVTLHYQTPTAVG